MRLLSTLALVFVLVALALTACDTDDETGAEDLYALGDITLDQETYQPGDTLTLSYDVLNPTLDNEGYFHIFVNLEVYHEDDPFDAYPLIDERTCNVAPPRLAHQLHLNPDYYLPGEYSLRLFVTNRLDDRNETLEETIVFTIIDGPLTEPSPEDHTPLPPQEEALLP